MAASTDQNGVVPASLRNLDRPEVALPSSSVAYVGCMLLGAKCYPLPAGSTIFGNHFFWHPAGGYLGTYEVGVMPNLPGATLTRLRVTVPY